MARNLAGDELTYYLTVEEYINGRHRKADALVRWTSQDRDEHRYVAPAAASEMVCARPCLYFE